MRPHMIRSVHRAKPSGRPTSYARFLATDTRNRLSKFWTPTGGISAQDGEQDDSHALLVRGGFLRQAHSGVFHLLPLGLRVQNKLENLIDRHMSSIGASKLSLSSISTEALWRQTGRYSSNSELLRINDRKESGFLLAPTHEEEITALVAGMVHSYKDLPLRLYQTGRKYRDERRPRQGLLRAKEFMMKDLYTFDATHDSALNTYKEVRQAYTNLFDELKIPYLVADADSGNMGGKLSHEYHFVSPKGEDNVWSCDQCEYVANEELVEKRRPDVSVLDETPLTFVGISSDRSTAVRILVPRPSGLPADESPGWDQISSFVNLHAIKNTTIDLDTGIEAATLRDLLPKTKASIDVKDRVLCRKSSSQSQYNDLSVTRVGDGCPRCSTGRLSVQKAIEVGHTFHLGTRYSDPLQALIAIPNKTQKEAIHMGCHGIGVSRLMGSIASLLSDEQGLNWPKAVAPFEIIVVTTPQIVNEESTQVYDLLAGLDTVIDDRPIRSLGWKLRDADMIGYPVIVVLGKAWKEKRELEIQCRRLGVKKHVGVENLRDEVSHLLVQL